jgi:predicted nicotinamide N-methyase
MPGYAVKVETVTVCGSDYQLQSLLDLQQFSDPDGAAERLGISSASWSLFGHLWPSARVLARLVHERDLAGLRVLEVGAGLALASLVIHRGGGNVTVSDRHPTSPCFLIENLRLNALGPLAHHPGNWAAENPLLGRFDLIIGSDVLYETTQRTQLAAFIDRHAAPTVEVLLVDPNRGHRVGFRREMESRGYGYSEARAADTLENGDAYKGRCLTFLRNGPAPA